MAHLVIDGYNYINRARSTAVGEVNLDMLRRSFLDKLFRYMRAQCGKITVVFDAYKSFS
jgi:predicted RNA-binding protein with PIN domain